MQACLVTSICHLQFCQESLKDFTNPNMPNSSFLFNTTSHCTIRVQNATQKGGMFASQSCQYKTSTWISLKACSNQVIQYWSPTASNSMGSTLIDSQGRILLMVSAEENSKTTFGTILYIWKLRQARFERAERQSAGYFSSRTCLTILVGLIAQCSSGKRRPPVSQEGSC